MTMHQPLSDGRYDSVSDFIEAMKLAPINPKNHELWQDCGFDDSRGGWYGAGCDTGKDVQRKVLEGWPEGRDRMAVLKDQIKLDLTPVDRRRRLVRRDTGDNLDIHAVYQGRLDTAWTSAVRRPFVGPQKIEIAANMICSGGEHADVLFWRGAAAAVLADALDAAGFMTQITVIFGGNAKYGNPVSCRIIVKPHGVPLDLATTATVTMPGFFRALGHAWISSHNRKEQSPSGISVGQGILEPNEILVSHNVRDHGTAAAFVRDMVEKINAAQGELAA